MIQKIHLRTEHKGKKILLQSDQGNSQTDFQTSDNRSG